MLKNFKIKDNAPRLIMLGNSNVGKSSITRYLLNNKHLTVGKIGKRAGSTVSLNLYRDPNIPYDIVDLPGFGAMTKTSKKLKETIHNNIINYVKDDKDNIFLALVILNCIRIPDELEKWYYKNKNTIPLTFEFVIWLNKLNLPSIVLLNKMDRVKKRELEQILIRVKQIFSEFGIIIEKKHSKEGLLEILPISAKKNINMKKLKDFINIYFKQQYIHINSNNERIEKY